MDKLSSFYNTFEIKSRSLDSIFRQLCQPADYKQLDKGTWKEALVNRYGDMMSAAPDLRSLAARRINEGLAARGHGPINAEHAYFNTFTGGYRESGSTAYFHDRSHLKESYSLVDAAIFDIFAKDWSGRWNELDNDFTNGIYFDGGNAYRWNVVNKLPFSSKIIADILKNGDSLATLYPAEFDAFWGKYADLYRDFVADSFLASALMQYRHRMLTDQGFALLRSIYYGNYPSGCRVTRFDVCGYYASDIICIRLDDRIILYIPGASMPFREFVSLGQVRIWVSEQLHNSRNRQALARHFSLADRKDTSTGYGVDSVLEDLGGESKPMNPYREILSKEQDYDLSFNVFDTMRDHIKARTDADKAQNPVNSLDCITEFAGFFLAQEPMIGMVMPEAPSVFDIRASRTPLGLDHAWVVKPGNEAIAHRCVGSRVNTDTFRTLDLLRVAGVWSGSLKNFSRPEDEIPAFASEEQAVAARFGLTSEQQRNVRVGDTPLLPLEGQPADIRLVRLADTNRPLAVIRDFAGNQYELLDTITLAETDGQLISAVKQEESDKIHYTSNGSFRGYLPFEPYRHVFEYLYTSERFKTEAKVFDKTDADVIAKVGDCLGRIHGAVTLRECLSAVWELMTAVQSNVGAEGQDDGFKKLLVSVKSQAEDVIFPDGMEQLKNKLFSVLSTIGPQAATYVYYAGMEELMGENDGLTAMLVDYALNDDITRLYDKGAGKQLADGVPSSYLYVIDTHDFNSLLTRYFSFEPYVSLGFPDNKTVFMVAFSKVQKAGLLDKCRLEGNKLCLGVSYEELAHTFSGLTNRKDELYIHSQTLFFMLRELAGDAWSPEVGMVRKYALPGHVKTVIDRRLSVMWDVYHLTENFDFSLWDSTYDDAFIHAFEPRQGEPADQTVARQIRQLLAGKGCALPANEAGVGFFLDNIGAFVEAGVTCIGVTSLYRDLIGSQIGRYMAGESMDTRLRLMLTTLDKGATDGVFTRLLGAARDKKLRLLPLGESDGSLSIDTDIYTRLYFRGATLVNAMETLPGDGKTVVFTHQYMMFSTPGINAPLPGITQCLNIPGAWVDDNGRLSCHSDLGERTTFPPYRRCQVDEDDMLPVVDYGAAWEEEPLKLMPEDGKLIAMTTLPEQEGNDPTASVREQILKATVSEDDWEGLRQDVAAIKELLADMPVDAVTSGSAQGYEAARRMEIAGYRPGNGVSLVWWKRNSDEFFYSPRFHVAPTVLLYGNEYVVDSAHKQFGNSDEGVIVLPIDDWAFEICNKAKATNPYLMYVMKKEGEQKVISPFVFMAPWVR